MEKDNEEMQANVKDEAQFLVCSESFKMFLALETRLATFCSTRCGL